MGLQTGNIALNASNIRVRDEELLIPTPRFHIGENTTLQHLRNSSIASITGNPLCNDTISISVYHDSLEPNDWLDYNPMIFLYVKKGGRKRNYHRPPRPQDRQKRDWIHPGNSIGGSADAVPLNRVGTNFGGGKAIQYLQTEWDYTNTVPYVTQKIEIQPHVFYGDPQTTVAPNFSLPILYSTWYNNLMDYGLRNFISSSRTDAIEVACRIKFAIIKEIDGVNRLILSDFSDTFVIRPKGGYFQNEDDRYFYDFEIMYRN